MPKAFARHEGKAYIWDKRLSIRPNHRQMLAAKRLIEMAKVCAVSDSELVHAQRTMRAWSDFLSVRARNSPRYLGTTARAKRRSAAQHPVLYAQVEIQRLIDYLTTTETAEARVALSEIAQAATRAAAAVAVPTVKPDDAWLG